MNKNTIAIILISFSVILVAVFVIGFSWQSYLVKRIETEANKNIVVDNKNNEATKQALVGGLSKKILYKIGNELILQDPATGEKSTILNSPDLIDFDLSDDQKFLVYSLKESGFDGNSDIYIKNLVDGETKRLTEKNNISSFNPKIFPDNSQVAYVRRVYDPATKKLSNGEIWLINTDGSIDSSRKIFSSYDESFYVDALNMDKVFDDKEKWTGEYLCVSKEELADVKIGIIGISPDGKVINYWKSEFAPECSGLWDMPYFSKIDGSDFLTEKFKKQNTFKTDWSGQQEINWEIETIFWFTDGSFATGQEGLIPICGESIYYFDQEQNKKWEIFDSFKQNAEKYDTQVFIDDIIEKEDGRFVIAYRAYKRLEDTKYFVDELNYGDKIDLSGLASKNYFAVEKLADINSGIFGVQILDDNNLLYIKQLEKSDYVLYLYDIINKKEKEIIRSTSLVDFDF